MRVALLLLSSLLLATAAMAQPTAFGAADDPREAPTRVYLQRDQFTLYGGPSLVTVEPYLAAGFLFDLNAAPLSARFSNELRAGFDGLYEPTMDEWYDVLRTIEFVRYDPGFAAPVYARVGPVQRMRLGMGHLVNFFSTTAAWDEREIGVEGQVRWPFATLGAFADNLLLNGVVGGELRVRPFFRWPDPRWNSLELDLGYVTDLETSHDPMGGVAAFSIEGSWHAFNLVDIYLAPYFGYARFFEHGQSWTGGVELASEDVIGLARFRLRLGLLASSRDFMPGYFGALYTINNAQSRIWDSEAYFRDRDTPVFEGIPLQDAGRAVAFETELRMLFFETFELWFHFRNALTSQRVSEMHFFLFVDPPRSDRFRFEFGVDRYGMSGYRDIFRAMEDLSAMVFKVDYRITRNVWAMVYSRYTYERAADGPDGQRRFLAQRRFEPFLGIRYRF